MENILICWIIFFLLPPAPPLCLTKSEVKGSQFVSNYQETMFYNQLLSIERAHMDNILEDIIPGKKSVVLRYDIK